MNFQFTCKKTWGENQKKKKGGERGERAPVWSYIAVFGSPSEGGGTQKKRKGKKKERKKREGKRVHGCGLSFFSKEGS